ncbi:MAG: DUF350 domain-containing protein [Mariprofundaceae bacterium]|nr:DUF350 domain-containing protein [Mariprofundaceae bacterium]
MNYIVLYDASITYYLIDLAIVLLILGSLRLCAGAIANSSLTEILSEKDNAAAGVSLAGAMLGVAIMMMGAVSGDAGGTPAEEAILMLIYGFLGIVLMWLTRIIFDRISLPSISISEEIHKDNLAAGLVDAGNMIASAIVVRALMTWVDGATTSGIMAILLGYAISQVLLVLLSRYRTKLFAFRHKGASFEQAIMDKNTALAVRFSGHRIGASLAITAASGLVLYNPNDLWMVLAVWTAVATVIFVAQTLVGVLTHMIFLPSIDVADEVGKQKNIAIGALEGAIYIAIGLVFAGLFG